MTSLPPLHTIYLSFVCTRGGMRRRSRQGRMEIQRIGARKRVFFFTHADVCV